MLWFKACPKCGGDLHFESDIYGSFVHCLQCSYELSDVQVQRLPYTPGPPAPALAARAQRAA